MPKKAFAGLPFPPLEKINADTPIVEAAVAELLKRRPKGISICIRNPQGHRNRGGYFFHIAKSETHDNLFQVFDFEKTLVKEFELAPLTRFINHCTGLAFDEEMFNMCQREINFRLDPQRSPEQESEAETLKASAE